jgi:phage terminase large subunit-like protein
MIPHMPPNKHKQLDAMTRGERVIAFIHKYCRVPEGDHVGKPMRLMPFQRKFILAIYDGDHRVRRAYLSIARKNGKALALDTPVPTPDGMKTMGSLNVGDCVYGPDGSIRRVIAATEPMLGQPCYRVTMADGESVVADARHQWLTDYKCDRRHGKPSRVRLTTEIGEGHRIPVAAPARGRRQILPVDPYFIGYWLGDGSSSDSRLCIGHADIENIREIFAEAEISLRKASGAYGYRVDEGTDWHSSRAHGIRVQLRKLGILGDKRIPTMYMAGDVDQRMALLQGLMDSDGSVSSTGQCTITQVKLDLADDIISLLWSLGYKPTHTITDAVLHGRVVGKRCRIQFWADKRRPVFRIERKKAKLLDAVNGRSTYRHVRSVEPVKSVPVRCIQVDHPDGLFCVGKTNLITHNSSIIACLVLVYLVGPEAIQNSQIICAAQSRDQASIVFRLASKMVRLNDKLDNLVQIVSSQKIMRGIAMNVEFKAISAEASTAHGMSPVVAILDEVGQVKGPKSKLVEAIETAQGAYEDSALLIAISTQASTDGDLFSTWLDDAEASKDPEIVSHVYSAPPDCAVADESAWRAANPAMGIFRSQKEIRAFAQQALRLPSKESSFRWLYLNQRVEGNAPFISRSLWSSCGSAPVPTFDGLTVYAGLDLSVVNDLTAFVPIAEYEDMWHVRPTFWLPTEGLRDRARFDRVPYDVWANEGYITTTPGKVIEYSFVAAWLYDFCAVNDVRRIGFDRFNWVHLKPWLIKAGFDERRADRTFAPFGQGFQSMSPALLALESVLLKGQMAHGDNPVLTMCAANATVQMDPAGNRKLNKAKAHGRIDGIVALAMAISIASVGGADHKPEYQMLIY